MTALLPPPTEHPSTIPVLAASATLTPATTSLLAGVIERLHREHEGYLPLATVIEVVTSCLEDIQATPVEALPELTERLARHRLGQIGKPRWS